MPTVLCSENEQHSSGGNLDCQPDMWLDTACVGCRDWTANQLVSMQNMQRWAHFRFNSIKRRLALTNIIAQTLRRVTAVSLYDVKQISGIKTTTATPFVWTPSGLTGAPADDTASIAVDRSNRSSWVQIQRLVPAQATDLGMSSVQDSAERNLFDWRNFETPIRIARVISIKDTTKVMVGLHRKRQLVWEL